MAEFINVKKGDRTKAVLLSEVDAAIADGWKPVGERRVTTETGERTVSTEEALRRLGSGEATGLVSKQIAEQEAIRHQQEIRQGDLSSRIQTLGESAASALTFGASDPALEGLSSELGYGAGDVAERQIVNPGYATAGTIIGTAVGAFAPGGVAKLLPGGLAANAARSVGARVLAQTGSKVAAGVAEGIADGALFGAGNTLSQLTLNDRPITAEAILAEIPMNALYGGALGGSMSLVGAGLGRVAQRMGEKRALREAASQVTESTADALKAARSDVTALVETNIRRITDDMISLGENLPKSAMKSTKALATEVKREARKIGSFDAEGMNNFLDKYNKLESAHSAHLTAAGFQPKALKELEALDLAAIANKHPEVAALNNASGPELAQFLESEMGLNASLVTSPTGEALAKTWAANKVLSGTAKAADPVTESIFKGAAGKAVGLAFRPAAAIGGILGTASRAAGAIGGKIGAGIESFIKTAGKARKGYVPAASAVLAKVRFDANLGEKPATKGSPKTGKPADELEKRRAELQSALANRALTEQRLRQQLSGLFVANPSVAEAALQKAMARLEYLNGTIPKAPMPGLFGPERYAPSATEVSKFSRIVAAAENPLVLLDELAAGRITPETVQTVKELYPEIFFEVQMGLLERIPEIREKVNYNGRIQLGILFGVPTDVVLQPQFIQKIQQNYLERDQAEQAQGNFSTPAQMGKPGGATEEPTSAQRLQAK